MLGLVQQLPLCQFVLEISLKNPKRCLNCPLWPLWSFHFYRKACIMHAQKYRVITALTELGKDFQNQLWSYKSTTTCTFMHYNCIIGSLTSLGLKLVFSSLCGLHVSASDKLLFQNDWWMLHSVIIQCFYGNLLKYTYYRLWIIDPSSLPAEHRWLIMSWIISLDDGHYKWESE